MIFHGSLSVSKSPKVSRTLLSILTDLNNAVVWMVSGQSKFSNHLIKLLGIVLSAQITIGITVTLMFDNFFFCSQPRFKYLSFFSFSLIFTLWSPSRFSFLLSITKSGHLGGIKWSVCFSKSQRSLSVLFSRTDSGLCI